MDLNLLYGSAVFFLIVASIIPYLYNRKLMRRVSLAFTSLASIGLIAFSGITLYTKKNFLWQIYNGTIPLSLHIDSLAAFFILLTAIISLCVGIYSFAYVEHLESRKDLFLSLLNFFIISLVLVISSSSLLTFIFFWELMSLASFLLVMTEYQNKDTQKAGIFYFVMTQFSTVFLLTAFIIIYHYTGSLDIKTFNLPSQINSIIFVLLFIGFGTKAGIIPFHKWLPYAHPASPSPISALMSGVMIKVAIYGLIRFLLLFTEQKLWWGILILVFGTISALLGVIYALKEHDLKRLLAYHSIENIGIILIGLGLYSIFTVFGYTALAVLGIAAALFHTLNHALFKSLLFLTAGSVVNATHTKNIEEMGGLMKKMPYTAILFLIGAISISALPPFNGFVSELMIFQVFFQSYLIPSPFVESILFISLSLLAMTSALAAACFVKAFAAVFAAVPRSEEAAHAKEAPLSMIVGPTILALLCAGLGIFSFQIFSFIGKRMNYSFPIPNMLWITASLLIMMILTIIFVKKFASTQSRVGETWGCGILSQNGKMEYTASGFSEPIITIFSSIYRTKKINERKFNDNYKANFKEGLAEIKLIKFFEEYMYLPIVKTLRFVSTYLYSLQNKVDVNSYILYSFLTIILLIIIVGWAA